MSANCRFDSLRCRLSEILASIFADNFVLRISNFHGATISRYSSPLNFPRFLLV